MSVVSVVCCQVEVSATGRSLVQRSPTDCGASLCVIVMPRLTMRRPWPTGGCYVMEEGASVVDRGNFRYF